ncbi:MAG: type I 3-dehydroquinate dehydratase [Candidatus Taylorbacteria bacterium]
MKTKIDLSKPNVVAVATNETELRKAQHFRITDVDVVEIRADGFKNMETLEKMVKRLSVPIILTVRDKSEGGFSKITIKRRREIFRLLLPRASLIDIELAQMNLFADVIKEARSRKVGIIGSNHNLVDMQTESQLVELLKVATAHKCDVFKVVAVASPKDLVYLLRWLLMAKSSSMSSMKMSLMSIGELGKVSRLLFARLGSVLNYGSIDEPRVRGQWKATCFKNLLREL